jgi:hypothetical protein
VSRLVGLMLVALIAQFNYQIVSTNPDFEHHYTIQGVLALWAISAVIFQTMLRSGWHADKVRIFWSAADIAFLTVELKLFEQILTGSTVDTEVHIETTLLVGYPLLIAASGLWWRVNLVWITTVIAMSAYGWLYADAAVRWHGGRFSWSPSQLFS